MAKLLATFKATVTRILFAAHGFIAIWQVTQNKKDPIYWSLCAPIGVLFIEGIFTLAIKKNQEWRWFCPSVFLYLSSIVPAIWLLELDKLDKRTRYQDQMLNETINLAATVGKDLKDLNKMLGVKIQLPDIQLTAEMWVTLIEQFLMLVLIIGRWMLPKGDLTRDQLSQLLLVYIGTAADIIEFFDSFKDAKIANEPVLVLLTLSIWSWSLLQFTIVLSATRARKPRGGGSGARGSAQDAADDANCCNVACCNIDVWGIALNILLQDAPFLTFRLLIIVHYKIITYMNIFFTCKNTLVILLQLYRLYVVNSENRKAAATKQRLKARGKVEQPTVGARHQKQRKISRRKVADIVDDDLDEGKKSNSKHSRKHRSSSSRKDTGYSTASSQTTAEQRRLRKTPRSRAGAESDGGDDPCPPSPPPPPPPASGGDTDTEKPLERRPKESKDRKSARHPDGKSGGSGRKKQPPAPPIDSDRSDDEIEAKARHKQRKRARNGTSETAGFEIIHEKSATGSRKKKSKPPTAEPSETGSSSSGSSTQSSASSTGSSSGTE
ncbi:transmembrane protein 26 [Anopheles ziemanni]|uniref:transmembrane protein 26 n=1 Tax=Anopheles coustani TaxID=139045 RepID=UPI002657EAF0|nr:transmembrane protein 26 [Anopheles coustani]XP_058169785.1 transmembrane protein 26 [Anopheles ziemanni]